MGLPAYIYNPALFSRLVLRRHGTIQGRSPMQSMLVFSHLRWDFVLQRPQHLMSRLARRFDIYFFEEPVPTEGAAWLEVTQVTPHLHVCRPHTPVAETGS